MTDATVTGSLLDALGEAYDYRRTKMWLVFNTQNGRVTDENGKVRVGAGSATVNADGTFSIAGIPVPAATSNPTSFQVKICYDAPPRVPSQRGKDRERGDFGWMTVTADADIKDLEAAQAVPAEYLTSVTQQLDAKVTEAAGYAQQAHDVSNISTSDGVVAALVPTSSGSATSAALNSAFAARAALASDVTDWALASVSHIDHLSSLAPKLQQMPYRRFNATGIGHSLMFGYWSNDDGTAAASDPRLRQRGAYRVSQQNLCRRFGVADPGEGVITMADARVTQSGAQAIASIGITAAAPGGYRLYNATGKSVTLTLTEPCTEIWIHGWQQTDAECSPFYYSLDGGADTLVTTAQGFPAPGSASDLDYTVKLRGLANTTHTLVIKSAVGNLIDLSGFSVWDNPTRGFAFNREAVGGAYLDSTVLLSTNGGNPKSDRITLLRPETDLLVIQFGTNEMTRSGETAGHTPSLYNTWLTDFVNVATNTYGIPVLLVSTVQHNPAGTDSATGLSLLNSYTERQYYDIHESIAAANPLVAHWDWWLLPEFASWNTANGLGLMWDNIHTNSKGALLTGLAFEAIIAAVAGNRIGPIL